MRIMVLLSLDILMLHSLYSKTTTVITCSSPPARAGIPPHAPRLRPFDYLAFPLRSVRVMLILVPVRVTLEMLSHLLLPLLLLPFEYPLTPHPHLVYPILVLAF